MLAYSDAQTTSDSAMQNYHMQGFYTKYLDDIRDDQLRYNANHLNDTGAIADVVNVVPFGVVENAMMFLNILILAIFTFFYNETFGAYFQNACAVQGSTAAAVASP